MRFFLYILLFISFTAAYGQQSKAKDGPIIKNFGKVYDVKSPDLKLSKDAVHKVFFDIYTDSGKDGSMNPLINTVARFLNMHGQQGVSSRNMKVAFVIHGPAVKNILSDEAYQEKFEVNNPNTDILKALSKADVDIFVCGQSLSARGYKKKAVSKHVLVALSAMTALVDYQQKGYKVINFN